MAGIIGLLIWQVALYSFGLFNYFFYLAITVSSGTFFQRTSERDRNEFLLARNKYWNLSQTVFDLHHRFFVLRNKLQLHYLTNCPTINSSVTQSKTLVIFLHGVPDSSLLWRYVTDSPTLKGNAILVAVDLPGFGGSDSFPRYGATEVLEALTEFIVGMRELYLGGDKAEDEQKDGQDNRVFLVGHDWGCLLGFRLATEASSLAHRFILTNAPHVPLALANKDRIVASSKKMLMTFLHAPIANRHCLAKAVHAIRPLAFQIFLFGYMAAFQLPVPMVKYLGVGGNYAFIRGAHKVEYGKGHKAEYNPQHSLAMTMGPGEAECQTAIDDGNGQQYGESVLARAKESGGWFLSNAAYYRDGAALDKWDKSIETLGAIYNTEVDNQNAMKGSSVRKRRGSSASSTLFSEPCSHSLKAPATIIWGKLDVACYYPICLQGIGDYLSLDSQVLMLPKSGHWTPIEKESRETFKAILERLVESGDLTKSDLQQIVQKKYPGAFVAIDR